MAMRLTGNDCRNRPRCPSDPKSLSASACDRANHERFCLYANRGRGTAIRNDPRLRRAGRF
jgi:hypothetical protein